MSIRRQGAGAIITMACNRIEKEITQNKRVKGKLNKMKLPAASGGVSKGIISIISPHPNPLPRERELVETPPQADGVFKKHNKNKFYILLWVIF